MARFSARSMKAAPRVDHHRLAGNGLDGLDAAHGDHRVGAVLLVGGLFSATTGWCASRVAMRAADSVAAELERCLDVSGRGRA
jgi:hypothetical protein